MSENCGNHPVSPLMLLQIYRYFLLAPRKIGKNLKNTRPTHQFVQGEPYIL